MVMEQYVLVPLLSIIVYSVVKLLPAEVVPKWPVPAYVIPETQRLKTSHSVLTLVQVSVFEKIEIL